MESEKLEKTDSEEREKDVRNGGEKEESDANGVKVEVENGCACEMEEEIVHGAATETGRCAGVENPSGVGSLRETGVENPSGGGSLREISRTYKRRRLGKVVGVDVKGSEDSASHVSEKSVEIPDNCRSSCMQANGAQINSQPAINSSSNYSPYHWRNVVLEQMFESLQSEGGLQKCIQDALLHRSESGCSTAVQEPFCSGEDGSKLADNCISAGRTLLQRNQNGAVGDVIVRRNESIDGENHPTMTEHCQQTFLDMITSENFAQLCSILLENFQGMSADKLFDIGLVHSRMKEGAYESSPMNFYSDIQRVWTKLQKVGTELITLSKSLTEKFRISYCQQVGGLMHCVSEDDKLEPLKEELDVHDQPETVCTMNKLCTCRQCGGKADGRDCLVCDSCEEMYHVSCIKPTVKEIPKRSWYCGKCSNKGMESPHDNCVMCDRLCAPGSPVCGSDDLINDEIPTELEASSNSLAEDEPEPSRRNKRPCCNVCKNGVVNGENIRLCGHSVCGRKFHVRCLTNKQLKTYGPRWYCPSCLCRACLTDRDDDKIVLCDGCDHAFHIYCMQPPRDSVPPGNWFCCKCDADIRRIRKAKRTYKNLQKKSSNGVGVPKGSGRECKEKQKKTEEVFEKSGGVDMLLSAAKTLNYQEGLAAQARER